MLKLLVLDDDPCVLRANARALKQYFDVVPAHNVEAAKLLAGDVDLMLLDWNIGNETSESLAIEFPIPAVVLTGAPHLVPEYLRVLAKPSAVSEIVEALNEEVQKCKEHQR